MPLLMQEFYARIDACNAATPEQLPALEQELWARFGTERTVFILDLAGFTVKVRRHGLLYFLRKIRYMQSVVGPLVKECGGELVKFEADNAYAVFAESAAAARCAVAVHARLRAQADGRPDVDDVQVCIGLARGRLLLVPGRDFFGDAVNTAARLGEDLASPGETLVATELCAELQGLPDLRITEHPCALDDGVYKAGRLEAARG